MPPCRRQSLPELCARDGHNVWIGDHHWEAALLGSLLQQGQHVVQAAGLRAAAIHAAPQRLSAVRQDEVGLRREGRAKAGPLFEAAALPGKAHAAY